MRFRMLGLLVAFVVGQSLAPAQSSPRGVPVSVGRPVAHPTSYQVEPIPTQPSPALPSAAAPMPGADQAMMDGQQEDPAVARRRQQDELKLNHYGPYERVWLGGGPMLLWMKDGPASGPLVSSGGRTLFGNAAFDFGEFWGWQINGGAWFNDCHTWGVEFGGFLTEEKSISAAFTGPAAGANDLSRPTINAITGLPLNVVIASPGIFDGRIGISATSELGGAEFNFVRNLRHCEAGNFDLIFGFRYLDLEESLNIAHQTRLLNADPFTGGSLFFANGPLPAGFPQATPPQTSSALPVGSVVTVADRFYTRNQMYAGQVGGRWEMWRGAFFVSATGKVAVGPNHETQKFTGSSAATIPGAPDRLATGGLLVVPPANFGRFTTSYMAVAPELGIKFGAQLSDLVRVSLGYNYFYLNTVVRPGSQVNQTVNTSIVPTSSTFGSSGGVAVPPALFLSQPRVFSRQDDFQAHGITMTVELRY